MDALFPKQFQRRVELGLMRLHEVEAAALDSGKESLARQLHSDKCGDLPNATFQIATELFVGQKQDIRIIAVRRAAPQLREPDAKLATVMAGGSISMSVPPVGNATFARRDPLLKLCDLKAGLLRIARLLRSFLKLCFTRSHEEPPFEYWD